MVKCFVPGCNSSSATQRKLYKELGKRVPSLFSCKQVSVHDVDIQTEERVSCIQDVSFLLQKVDDYTACFDATNRMESQIEKSLLDAARVIEDQIDAAIEKLDNLEDEDLEAIQRKRAAALKKEMKMKEEWIASGHGEYTTLTSEKEFFEVCKKSKNVVLHCYRDSTMRCAIVDKHLALLANKHIETKFCKLDVEKAPFLCDRLKIRIIPTIILCKEGQTIDFIIGFDDMGGTDDFSTEMMEWRLGRGGVINYEEDLNSPPDSDAGKRQKVSFIKHVKKNIRGGACGSDSD